MILKKFDWTYRKFLKMWEFQQKIDAFTSRVSEIFRFFMLNIILKHFHNIGKWETWGKYGISRIISWVLGKFFDNLRWFLQIIWKRNENLRFLRKLLEILGHFCTISTRIHRTSKVFKKFIKVNRKSFAV